MERGKRKGKGEGVEGRQEGNAKRKGREEVGGYGKGWVREKEKC